MWTMNRAHRWNTSRAGAEVRFCGFLALRSPSQTLRRRTRPRGTGPPPGPSRTWSVTSWSPGPPKKTPVSLSTQYLGVHRTITNDQDQAFKRFTKHSQCMIFSTQYFFSKPRPWSSFPIPVRDLGTRSLRARGSAARSPPGHAAPGGGRHPGGRDTDQDGGRRRLAEAHALQATGRRNPLPQESSPRVRARVRFLAGRRFASQRKSERERLSQISSTQDLCMEKGRKWLLWEPDRT